MALVKEHHSHSFEETLMINEILNLVNKHEEWRGKQCLNLIPSENVMSPPAHKLLSSDFAHRYTTWDKFYAGTRYTDEIEHYGEKLAKELFKAETADLRPLSGHIADLIILANFKTTRHTNVNVSTRRRMPWNMGRRLSWALQTQSRSIPPFLARFFQFPLLGFCLCI
jgi:glycine/serine hydroxymethyltransferase